MLIKHPNPSHTIPQNNTIPQDSELTADQALRKLLAGNHRFVRQKAHNPNQSADRLSELSKEQKPFATILGCSDSRVPLEVIFDQGLGDLFVVRVAGNVVTPSELASIEYGVSILQTRVLLVLGHSQCGAVKAALTGGQLIGHLHTLTDLIQPAIARSLRQPGDAIDNGVRENILLQTERLRNAPIVAQLLDEKRLQLVGGYFDLKTGEVSILSIATSQQATIRTHGKPVFSRFSRLDGQSQPKRMLHLKITNLDSGEYQEVFCAPELNAQTECTIGRGRGCNLVLNGDTIDRIHAKIVVQPEGYCLIDANSRAGCYLNDRKIHPNQLYPLSQSDAIEIGNFFILVHQF
ncbi:carbonic anhydrase [Egbenema bharatensis]|uniref:carbonic anhydrase n=1 Tax=Egbenema bharatensis TaxID=3463334 RepID=UPI003A88A33E